MWLGLLTALPLLLGSLASCESARALKSPTRQDSLGSLSILADRAWESQGRAVADKVRERHARLHYRWREAAAALPTAVDAPEEMDRAAVALSGTYGTLPEVHVDRDPGAVFPAPIRKPVSFSWFAVAVEGHALLRRSDELARRLEAWEKLPAPEKARSAPALASAWDGLDSRVVSLSRSARYLSMWRPRLETTWQEALRQGSLPQEYRLVAALQEKDSAALEGMRESLRPRRVMTRPFLPAVAQGVITVPVRTDVQDPRFLRELEGAIETHWNQSRWAREKSVRFKISWTQVAANRSLASGQTSLENHLEQFGEEVVGITTGGLSTFVRNNVLVLGPGKIQPRTLAHEFGHLLGFEDCYFRTITGRGILGVAVMEWDNPVFPDELMCDNNFGAARAAIW